MRRNRAHFNLPEGRGAAMYIELSIDGVTVINAELDLPTLVRRLQEAEECGLWLSAPLTFDQAKDLVSRLDTRTLELVRQTVFRGRVITWPNAMEICGITTGGFHEFDREWLNPLDRMVETVRDGEPGVLISWVPDTPEWHSEDRKDLKFYIDGPALKALRKVLIG